MKVGRGQGPHHSPHIRVDDGEHYLNLGRNAYGTEIPMKFNNDVLFSAESHMKSEKLSGKSFSVLMISILSSMMGCFEVVVVAPTMPAMIFAR